MHSASRRISIRAFVIGTMLVPILCYWNVYSDIVAQSTELGDMSLSIGAVSILLALLALNAALRRWAPRYRFTQAELLFIYVMQTVSIVISSVGHVQFLSVGLNGAFYFATPENGWAHSFYPYFRAWAFPKPAVVHDFFIGQSTLFTPAHLLGWVAPILTWSAFIICALGVMLCLNSILRRRWVDQERLTFPIVTLPLSLTREHDNFLQSRALWSGFLIAFLLENMAAANYLYPSLPFVPIKPSDPRLDLSQWPMLTGLFNTPPWSSLGQIQLSFYPVVIGLIYLLPSDVSFSCWAFYFIRKLEEVLATGLGFHDPGASPALARVPYIGEQSGGAFIGLAILMLWSSRGYLRQVFRTAFGSGPGRLDDSDEPMPYRWALIGAGTGFVAMVAFAMLLGMSGVVAVILFALLFLVIITFTRIRAEAGLPWAFGPDMTPHQMITSAAGPDTLGAPNMVALAQFQWMDLDYRATVMPAQLEGMKIAGEAGMSQRSLLGSMLLATVIATISAWVAILACYYHYGAASAHVDSYRTGMGRTPWQLLSDWINFPNRYDILRFQGVAVGIIVVALLVTARMRFLWWPLHPIGYVLAGTFTMQWLWCATFVGWLCKVLVLRYGGMKSYRSFLPFFIGLILGDYVAGAIWALVGTVSGMQVYRVLPI